MFSSASIRCLRCQTVVEKSLEEPPPGNSRQCPHWLVKCWQPKVTWQSAVAGHISCIVHTTGFPLCRIFWIPLSESMPWLIQCRWITSASLNSGNFVMSEPALAISTSKRCWREKCKRQKITSRSHKNCQRRRGDWGNGMTVSDSVSLSRTSIFAFAPLLFSAFIRRLAATAAPPVRSLVLTISILIFTLMLQRYNKFC